MARIHDVTIAQTARFTRTGQVTPAVIVRYFVDDHGPYTDQYDEKDFTPDTVKALYQKRVDMLRAAGVIVSDGVQF